MNVCEHCGQPANFYSKYTKKWRCCKSSNQCPGVRKKNSEALIKAHKTNPNMNNHTRGSGKMGGWDNFSETQRKEIYNKSRVSTQKLYDDGTYMGGFLGKKHTRETIEKIRKSRIEQLSTGIDTSGRGLRGHYDGMFFHSSWELAFYVFMKEMKNIILSKNTKWTFSYIHEGKKHAYIPDFIDPNDQLYEIKAFMYSEKELTKLEMFASKVKWMFKDDMEESLNYCKSKYGERFTDVLYE